MPKSKWFRALLALVAVLLLIQLYPYGRAHANPPVTGEPDWDSPTTEASTFRARANCMHGLPAPTR